LARLATAFLLVSFVASPAFAQSGPLTLFLGAATQGEFVDTSKDVEDSIKDLAKKMRGIKGLVLVKDRAQADLVLTVVSRGIGSEPYGQRLALRDTYSGTELTSQPISMNTWWVATVLEVPAAGYRKEFVGAYTHPPGLDYYGGAWTECASRLSKNLKVWLDANAERVRAKRNASD
jgi:hypothetical protein